MSRETGKETHMAIFPGVPKNTGTHCGVYNTQRAEYSKSDPLVLICI